MKTISRKTTALLLALSLSGLSAACAQDAAAETALETDLQKVSYAIGLNMGQSMQQQGAEFDLELLFEGLEDGYTGGESRMDEQQVQQVLQAFQQQMMAKQQQQYQQELTKNQAAADEFLAQNAQAEGVQQTESGLQYQIVEPGTGEQPTAEDTVTVHYKGTTLSGTQFDSSYDRGQPTTFGVNQVIQGWQEALPMMKEGAKWKVWVPPALGYAERGAPPKIGPNELLVFEMELLEVADEAEPAEEPAPAEQAPDGGK